MIWNHSEVLALASQHCVSCFGLGLKQGRNGRKAPCGCTLRKIFRACYRRFESCSQDPGRIGRVTLDQLIERDNTRGSKPSMLGKRGTRGWSMKQQEYAADFILIARRALDEADYKFFRLVFLLGAAYQQACPRLGLDRGEFFHAKYRIEEALGKAFAECQPHPLWPIDEYFGLHAKRDRRAVHPILRVDTDAEPARAGRKLKYPLAA